MSQTQTQRRTVETISEWTYEVATRGDDGDTYYDIAEHNHETGAWDITVCLHPASCSMHGVVTFDTKEEALIRLRLGNFYGNLVSSKPIN